MCLVSIEPEQNCESDYIKITICFYLKYSSKWDVNTKIHFLLKFSILEIGVLLKNSGKKLFGNLIFVNLIMFATFHTEVVWAYFQPLTNDTQKNCKKKRTKEENLKNKRRKTMFLKILLRIIRE